MIYIIYIYVLRLDSAEKSLLDKSAECAALQEQLRRKTEELDNIQVGTFTIYYGFYIRWSRIPCCALMKANMSFPREKNPICDALSLQMPRQIK